MIEFRDVWFAYKNEDWVLKGVSFTVNPGESVALVGHTGSGKTTITNLLMRFYDIQRGKILLDGVDLRDWDLESLRKNFAVVLQDIFLFSGTVESNIRLGRADISDERVRWAAQEVHAQFIERLREGYKSEVKERGAGLSVGQKQLISFARALAFDPALLILDEATSSIDTETEQSIQQAIGRVMQDRTSIVVAHRLSTIQRADQIIVMHHGEIREQGTHQELLAKHGLYWMLYKLQYADGARPQLIAGNEENATRNRLATLHSDLAPGSSPVRMKADSINCAVASAMVVWIHARFRFGVCSGDLVDRPHLSARFTIHETTLNNPNND